MKGIFLSCFLVCIAIGSFSQPWTADQLAEANTAADLDYLSAQEKQVILYINLCRLYPKQFAVNEVKTYYGIPGVKDRGMAKYKTSLVKDLALREPCDALEPDDILYDDAHCYAVELSSNKRAAHQRIDCEKSNYAECLFWGTNVGKNIALEWLIDTGVAQLGHRKNCLNPAYTKTGIHIETHFQYGHCAVAEFTY